MSADLTHVDTWLFDLDNTLYPASTGFMGEIEGRMTAFVQKVTGLPRDEAYTLQKQYLAERFAQRFGAGMAERAASVLAGSPLR